MNKTTQRAWTDDQIRVLELAEEHPDATPGDLTELLEDSSYDHLSVDYVSRILDGFHLPEDHDRPDSEAAKRVDGDVDNGETLTVTAGDIGPIQYRCTLCDAEKPKLSSARRHVSAKDDDAHAGRDSDEDHLVEPVGDGADVLKRLGSVDGVRGPLTPDHATVLCAFYDDPDRTAAAVADAADVGEGTVMGWMKDLGLGAGASREEMDAVLSEANLSLRPPDAEDETATPTSEAEVQRLSPGDGRGNTVVGGWYEATVNGVENYGVFCTLAKGTPDDLSGLAHENDMAGTFVPGDYSVGDGVVVERLPDQDDTNLTLRMVSDSDGEIVADGPIVPPEDGGDGGQLRREAGNAAYEGPAEGVDMTMQYISEADAYDDVQDTDGDGFFEGRIEEYEQYWQWVDRTRWVGAKLSNSMASKFDSESSPLARAYNESMGAKHDWQDNCRDITGTLPTYRDQFGEPAWDHRVEAGPKGDGDIYLPADFETPAEWDEGALDDLSSDAAAEKLKAVEQQVEQVAEMVEAAHRNDTDRDRSIEDRLDAIEESVSEGGVETRLDVIGRRVETIESHIDAIEVAAAGRDSRDPDRPFTLYLSADEMKRLVKEAPEDVSDLALDALAEGAQ